MSKRPAHVKPPAHWTHEPAPEPQAVAEPERQKGRNGLDPVRYGDWEHSEHGGRIVDF